MTRATLWRRVAPWLISVWGSACGAAQESAHEAPPGRAEHATTSERASDTTPAGETTPAETSATPEPATTATAPIAVASPEMPHDVPAEVPRDVPADVPHEVPREMPITPPTSVAEFVAIDTHVDTTQRLLDEHADLATELPNGHLDVPRMRRGGLTAAFFSIWVDPRDHPGEAAWARAEALVGAVEGFVAAHPNEVVLARTAEDVRRANAEGRVAFLMGIEGAHALGDTDVATLYARLESMAARGVRYMTVTWTNDNVFAHASTGRHPRQGLTDAGRELVHRMNRLGMVVDVSHVSDRTVADVLDESATPVFASHSSARALADHPRNLPDRLVRRIASAGGAVCVNYYAHFLDPAYATARRALEAAHRDAFDAHRGHSWQTADARNALARELAPELHPPDLDVLVQHFQHLATIGGPGAVCLGSDFDGVSELPTGLPDVAALPVLFRRLRRARLDVPAIAGGNVLRVLEANEAFAHARAANP